MWRMASEGGRRAWAWGGMKVGWTECGGGESGKGKEGCWWRGAGENEVEGGKDVVGVVSGGGEESAKMEVAEKWK